MEVGDRLYDGLGVVVEVLGFDGCAGGWGGEVRGEVGGQPYDGLRVVVKVLGLVG